MASRTTTIGTGNLTFTFGTATVSGGAMTGFTAAAARPSPSRSIRRNSTLDGIAKAINAAKAGVTATVITDADGSARLSLKGATGTASAFTVSGDTPELAVLNVGKGQTATTIGSTAGNAALKLDGVAVERASNSISDLIDGVKLDLTSASVGNPVTIGSSTPTAGLTQAVTDFVDTFNQMQAIVKEETDAATGSLHNDSAAKQSGAVAEHPDHDQPGDRRADRRADDARRNRRGHQSRRHALGRRHQAFGRDGRVARRDRGDVRRRYGGDRYGGDRRGRASAVR